MSAIAIVVRELTYLKILQPIMQAMHSMGVKYALYHFDAPRGSKEYNRASLKNIKKSSTDIIENASRVVAFSNDKQLLSMLIKHKIKKLVSIEIWLWAKSYINSLKKNGIKTFSIMYLTDSLWQPKEAITTMDRVYYSSEHIMSSHHRFVGISKDSNRDRCIGSPIFDPISDSDSSDDILVLLPNLKAEHVKVSFGSTKNFVQIIKKLSTFSDLVFKTRKKQWLPDEIKKYAKEIIDDGNIMYPPASARLFGKYDMTAMFYSSGIYEAVFGGSYVLNIKLPVKRWAWDKNKMKEYFGDRQNGLYSFDGVARSVSQEEFLSDSFIVTRKKIDPTNQKIWINRFIGSNIKNGCYNIVKDIMV